MDFIKNDTHNTYFTTLDYFLPVTQFCGEKFRDGNHTLLLGYQVGITDGDHSIYLFFFW